MRGAAALSLGGMKSKSSIPQLEAALKDKEGAVVMAAGKSLIQLGDEKGYSVYYASSPPYLVIQPREATSVAERGNSIAGGRAGDSRNTRVLHET